MKHHQRILLLSLIVFEKIACNILRGLSCMKIGSHVCGKDRDLLGLVFESMINRSVNEFSFFANHANSSVT